MAWDRLYLRKIVRLDAGDDWVSVCREILTMVQANYQQKTNEGRCDDWLDRFYRDYIDALEIELAESGARQIPEIDDTFAVVSYAHTHAFYVETRTEDEMVHDQLIDKLLDEGVLDD